MLHTIGYEGRTLDEVVRLLHERGVEVLADVRGTARSRKRGFAKRRLAEALDASGIAYRHEPALGVPRDERAAFRAGEPDTLARYRRGLDEGDARAAVEDLAVLAATREVALLCFERDEAACHRRLVAEAVLAAEPAVAHHPID